MAYVYLSLKQLTDVHEKTVAVSGGGSYGHLELGKLEAALQHIQNDDYYPTFELKLSHLFFCICKFHSFEDGNKRIAIAACAQMLLLNGYLRSIDAFIRKSENISYHVAAGRISKELLTDWVTAILYGREDDEALKLKILLAISGDD